MAKSLNLPKERTFLGPAQLWKRALSFILDLLIMDLFVLWPFRRLFGALLHPTGSVAETYQLLNASPGTARAIFLIFALAFLFIMMYFVILDYLIGQTVGMMLLKIRVVSKEKKLGFFQCFVRNIFILPFFPFIILWIVDPLFAMFTKTHQRMTEMLSRTSVIEKYSL